MSLLSIEDRGLAHAFDSRVHDDAYGKIESMARAGEELVNPITGERIVFRKTAADTGGKLLEMDDFWTQRGHRAPVHIHPEMQERWEILSGTACFRIAGSERTAGPGEVVVADPGVPHLAWNPTDERVHLRIQMRPALHWERFVERLFALVSNGVRGERGDPEPVLMLELLREFPREIALVAPEP
ncbi:MAG TPA: cupin domain-containing protein [Solirubrobacteraceae bacterium]|nr:cupin domain-containing protein [Solirubrobacteraceae bacterium]